jgi:hypothetical protein
VPLNHPTHTPPKGALAQARLAHHSAPCALHWCTLCGVGWVVAWTAIAVAIGICVLVKRVTGGCTTSTQNTWEGYPKSRARLIDQLERYGPDSNNVILSGDMHALHRCGV